MIATGLLALCGVAAAQGVPPPPYYSVQLATNSAESLAMANLDRVSDEAYARVEMRGNAFALRVGAWIDPQQAFEARERLRAGAFPDAAVLRIVNVVDWITLDGVIPAATMTAAVEAVEDGSGPPADPGFDADVAEQAPGTEPEPPPVETAAAELPSEPSPEPEPAPPPPEPEPEPVIEALSDAELAAISKPQTPWWTRARSTLRDIGREDGMSLEFVQGENRIYLPMPPGTTPESAELVLDLSFGESLVPYSTIRIAINDVPRRVIRRDAAGPTGNLEVRIPLNARDLREPFVFVRINHALLIHDDICIARDLVSGYANIGPDSGLDVKMSGGPPASVRAAWSTLPRDVLIQADLDTLDRAEYHAILELATLLYRDGHRFRIEKLPEDGGLPTGHVVVASPARYGAWGVDPASGLDADTNLSLAVKTLQNPDRRKPPDVRSFILVDGSRPIPAAQMMRLPWRALSGGTLLDVQAAELWPPAPADNTPIAFRDLGFTDTERRFNFSTTWDVPLPFGPMGDGKQPREVRARVYAPGARDIKRPVILSAYYNGRLVASQALTSESGPDQVSFQLPPHLLRARNSLNLVAARDEPSGQCSAPTLTPQPVSVSDLSVVTTRDAEDRATTFAELVPHQRNLTLYLSADAVDAAPDSIAALVALGEHFWPDVPAPTLRFFNPGESLAPEGHFLVVGRPNWDPEGPVEMGQGRVRVFSNATRDQVLMLDVTSNASYGVLQMVQAGAASGAWLVPTLDYGNLPVRRVLFEDENLAVLDGKGVQLTLRVGATRDYEVDYPDASSWLEVAGRWRTVLFVLVWVILAGLIIYLLRQSRLHRGDSKADSTDA